MSFQAKLLYSIKEALSLFRTAPELGAHSIVSKDSQILLVRLTYYKGWFLPGGAVDSGEAFQDAMKRELREECGIDAKSWKLFGLYINRRARKTSHVAVYIVTEFDGEPKIATPQEIAEVRFFSPEELPKELWSGHRKRIEEYLGRREIEVNW